MKDLDIKNIVNKVISWGFSATFAILGIVLMALHKQIDLPIYAGLVVSLFGAFLYALTFFIENKVKQVSQDNKALQTKIIELENKIDNLNLKLTQSQTTISNLQQENKRKQSKIDKYENKSI